MKNSLCLFLLISLFTSCSTKVEVNPNCGENVIIDDDLYKSVKNEFLEIENAVIVGDCLEISITSGGCDGKNWVVELIDANAIAESLPPQRYLKISLKNPEVCNAIITRKFEFNLTPIRIPEKEIILNLENWDGQLIYRY